MEADQFQVILRDSVVTYDVPLAEPVMLKLELRSREEGKLIEKRWVVLMVDQRGISIFS